MARSRLSGNPLIDKKRYATFSIEEIDNIYSDKDLLSGIRSFIYTIKRGDRADHLAARFLGDDEYDWVVLLVNNIKYPFSSGGWVVGKKIRIPFDVNDVLAKILP